MKPTWTGKAATTFGNLSKGTFSNKKLTPKSSCISNLSPAHCSESQITYTLHEFSAFDLGFHRENLRIKWQDKIICDKTKFSVLKSWTPLVPLNSFSAWRHFGYIGHIHHMGIARIPRQLLYGGLAAGKQEGKSKFEIQMHASNYESKNRGSKYSRPLGGYSKCVCGI